MAVFNQSVTPSPFLKLEGQNRPKSSPTDTMTKVNTNTGYHDHNMVSSNGLPRNIESDDHSSDNDDASHHVDASNIDETDRMIPDTTNSEMKILLHSLSSPYLTCTISIDDLWKEIETLLLQYEGKINKYAKNFQRQGVEIDALTNNLLRFRIESQEEKVNDGDETLSDDALKYKDHHEPKLKDHHEPKHKDHREPKHKDHHEPKHKGYHSSSSTDGLVFNWESGIGRKMLQKLSGSKPNHTSKPKDTNIEPDTMFSTSSSSAKSLTMSETELDFNKKGLGKKREGRTSILTTSILKMRNPDEWRRKHMKKKDKNPDKGLQKAMRRGLGWNDSDHG
eukprot:g1692.t1